MLQQHDCWVLGGDKTLNVLSRLFRNVGEELNDPYVLFHMAQLSGPLRSHLNPMCFIRAGCTRRLWGNKSINHGWITYWNQQQAWRVAGIPPSNPSRLIANVSSCTVFGHCGLQECLIDGQTFWLGALIAAWRVYVHLGFRLQDV